MGRLKEEENSFLHRNLHACEAQEDKTSETFQNNYIDFLNQTNRKEECLLFNVVLINSASIILVLLWS